MSRSGLAIAKRLAGDQPRDIGQALACTATGIRADEHQAVAQDTADRIGVDDLVARGIVGRGAGERKDYVAARAALDLLVGQIGWRHEDVDAHAAAACQSVPTERSAVSSVGSP